MEYPDHARLHAAGDGRGRCAVTAWCCPVCQPVWQRLYPGRDRLWFSVSWVGRILSTCTITFEVGRNTTSAFGAVVVAANAVVAAATLATPSWIWHACLFAGRSGNKCVRSAPTGGLHATNVYWDFIAATTSELDSCALKGGACNLLTLKNPSSFWASGSVTLVAMLGHFSGVVQVPNTRMLGAHLYNACLWILWLLPLFPFVLISAITRYSVTQPFSRA